MKPPQMLDKRRFLVLLGISALICLAVVLIAPLVGPAPLGLQEALFDKTSRDAVILFRARVPRVLFAVLVGGALASSGVVFQAVLRNPLASPFTLGISGGGSLGAVVAIILGWEVTYFGFSLLPIASMAGALGVILIVYTLAGIRGRFSPLTLLLSGVVLNYVCAALILLLHYFSDFTQSFLMMRWMMGGLDIFDYRILVNVAPFLLAGGVVLFRQARYLNALSAGRDWAGSRGIDVKRLITYQYFGASLMTGSVIAYSGPIGFVGLIVPHILRLLVGPDHRILLPASFLLGGAFLVLCDTAARTLLAPTEIPVGIFTSLLGGPFFLWFLIRSRNRLFF